MERFEYDLDVPDTDFLPCINPAGKGGLDTETEPAVLFHRLHANMYHLRRITFSQHVYRVSGLCITDAGHRCLGVQKERR